MLSSFLEAHSLIYVFQVGFRPGHSTQTALVHITDEVRNAIDRYKLTILIDFEVSKVFGKLYLTY